MTDAEHAAVLRRIATYIDLDINAPERAAIERAIELLVREAEHHEEPV